jgi:hypothetical protein
MQSERNPEPYGVIKQAFMVLNFGRSHKILRDIVYKGKITFLPLVFVLICHLTLNVLIFVD